MGPNSDQSDKNRSQKIFNLTLAAVAGQVGCLTLVIIMVALFGGMWLDNRFGSGPLFTIGLTIASIPVTLVLMLWVVRAATTRLQTNSTKEKHIIQEETNGGKKS
jgi:uncharacterized membrane protein